MYNEEDNDLYVHHDILLDTFPLALEWLNFDPEDDNKQGLYVTKELYARQHLNCSPQTGPIRIRS